MQSQSFVQPILPYRYVPTLDNEKGLNYNFNRSYYLISDEYKKYLVENKIKTMETSVFYIKKKSISFPPKHIYFTEYSPTGNLILNRVIKKDELRSEVEIGYNSIDKPVTYKFSEKGEIKYEEKTDYNSDGNPIACMLTKGDEKKPVNKWIAEFNENKKIISKKFFKKEEDEVNKLWTYEYYSDGANKQTNYFIKGKLKKTWSFACDHEGKETKLQDTIELCEYTEYHNDGSFTEVFRTTAKNNKIEKTLKTYDVDTNLIGVMSYHSNDKISYGYEKKIENDHLISYTRYSGGKLCQRVFYIYNESDLIVKTIVISKKNNFETNYAYFEKGKVKSQERLKNGELIFRWENEIDEQGNICKVKRINKKGEEDRMILYKNTYY